MHGVYTREIASQYWNEVDQIEQRQWLRVKLKDDKHRGTDLPSLKPSWSGRMKWAPKTPIYWSRIERDERRFTGLEVNEVNETQEREQKMTRTNTRVGRNQATCNRFIEIATDWRGCQSPDHHSTARIFDWLIDWLNSWLISERWSCWKPDKGSHGQSR